MKLSETVMNVLAQCTVKGNVLFLPPNQLERKVYEAVNKCLMAMGGKWDRKARGHVFEESPALTLEAALTTGEQVDPRQQLQFFETPEFVACHMAALAQIGPGHHVLEPSAGRGAIARFLPATTLCIELYDPNVRFLKSRGHTVIKGDFLIEPIDYYHRIVMNPPFTRNQDIAHVRRAYDWLLPGGRLVAIMSEHPFFAQDKESVAFRDWFGEGYNEKLPPGTFATTGVSSRIVVIDKEPA
jgi:hypothetical protein